MKPILYNQRGFSVLEVTIAAVLTVGLMGVAFSLVNQNQGVYTAETNVTDMNQNVRVAMDLLTRDLQTAGMGLPHPPQGNMAAIYYVNGASGGPDAIMILNGDAYAPTVGVQSLTGTTFTCVLTGGITATGTGTSSQFTYVGPHDSVLREFLAFSSANPKYYVVYDGVKANVMALALDGQRDAVTGNLTLEYDPSNYRNPATLFSTALGGATVLDTGDPNVAVNSTIAMLSSMVAYRVNAAANELERTEDLSNWYSVARGITDLQIRYGIGNTDVKDEAPGDRGAVRSVEVTLRAETADLPPTAKGYRQVIQQFEVAPRNFNLVNNINLSSNLD